MIQKDDLVEALTRSKRALTENGFIVVKDNIAEDVRTYVATYSAYAKTEQDYMNLFERAGLKLVKTLIQKDFPEDFFPVKMYLLK